MWTRLSLKTKAKKFLSQNYVTAFFVSFVLMLVTFESASTRGSNSRWTMPNSPDFYFSNGHIEWNNIIAGLPVFSFAILIVVSLAIALRVFLGYILEVGGRNYFLRGTEREVTFKEIGFGFNSNYYFNIVITMLIKSIYNFLWFCLFFFPGVVKMYAYSMVPYILADNPNIDSQRAIELSIQMTDGEKWDMFVLDLSFIGWYIVGSLLFGIGIWFVNPYVDATKAQLYTSLRLRAIKLNLCTPEELCYVATENDVEEANDWYDEY